MMDQMACALKPKNASQLTATREGSVYQLHIEDLAGKRALFEFTSDQAVRLADMLDNLLADEEEEHPNLRQPEAPPKAAPEIMGTVKWYNTAKGFGFVTTDGQELFLHHSVLEQAGFREIAEGTRVRIQVRKGEKGLQVSAIALA